MAKNTTATDTTEAAEPVEVQKKKITIKLPFDMKNNGDEYVAVNGRSYQIPRGVAVEVPEEVLEVLRHKEEMEMHAVRNMTKQQNNFATDSQKYGIG